MTRKSKRQLVADLLARIAHLESRVAVLEAKAFSLTVWMPEPPPVIPYRVGQDPMKTADFVCESGGVWRN